MPMSIKYATCSDGARTAYGVIGDGPALVFTPGWVSHLEVFEDNQTGKRGSHTRILRSGAALRAHIKNR
jgi:hypothetical protein